MLDGKRVCILYGSETGAAQDISERIGRQATHYGFSSCVMPMDEYPIIKLVEETVAVFVCSTTGQGEEPGNMKRFWKFLLRKNLPSDCLNNLNTCVLGLGDSSYTKFNFAAKKLRKRLLQLGAKEILQLGLADDQHDLGADAVVDEWIKDLWSELFRRFVPDAHFQMTDKIPIGEPKYEVHFLDQSSSSAVKSTKVTQIFAGKVVSNTRVTSDDHFQDVRLIKIDLLGSDMEYQPGDVAAIYPSNLSENVEEFFDIFPNIQAESRVNVKQNNPNIPLPKVIIPELGENFYPESGEDHIWKDLVNYYFDIQGLPRRYFFELFENFTGSELEKEKLEEFLSKDGQRDLYNYCHSARRSSLEVLRDFPHATECIPLKYVFDLFPPIKPRSFSIASESADQLELLIAVVNYKTKLLKPRLGLCSNWISRLRAGDKVPICVKKGTFTFPKNDVSVPIIMIGPGTGCAPFRGFLLRRQKLNLGNNFLFFGCRNRNADYFFENEWNGMQEKGLLQVFTAFSRDQDHKIYVQDVMMEQKHLLWRLINNEKAYVFLAGNAKDMPKEVEKTLISIFITEGELDDEKANIYFKQLAIQNRFQSETWS